VVPLVNWILIVSSARSASSGTTLPRPPASSSSYRVSALYFPNSTCGWNARLSTATTLFKLGTTSLSTLPFSKSGTSALKSSRLLRPRPGLYGRSVTLPITSTSTPRCLSAAATCFALKPGLSGTSTAPSLKAAYVSAANSAPLPRETARRSPLRTPRERRPCARELESTSRS
ncbi:hypothetical protein N0V92_013990, partial [Colletotrichum tropicale]